MPLVTDKFFESLWRITVWRLLFMVGIGMLLALLATLPLMTLVSDAPGFPAVLYVAWIGAAALVTVGGWRWLHWHRVMKANIFDDTTREPEERSAR